MNNKTKFGIWCVSILIFCFFTYFLSSDICAGDDFSNIASLMYGGGKYNIDSAFTSALSIFFGYWLPSFFHINPHQFSMTIGAVIRSFDAVLLFLIMSLFFYCGRPKKSLVPLTLIISALYFCYASANMNFDQFNPNKLPQYDLEGSFIMLTEYAQHFGQMISFIFALFSIYFLIGHFAENKLLSRKKTLVLTLSVFLSAFSSMFSCITVGITLGLMCCYLYFSNFKENQKLLKNISFPVCAYIIGACIFGFYPGFFGYFSLKADFMIFFKTLYNGLVIQNSLEFALIIILASVLYFLALNKTVFIKRVIFSVFSVICSIFIYFILFSKLESQVVIQLTESVVLVRLLLFSLILLLFGSCQKELVTEKVSLKILKIVMSLIIIVFSIIQTPFVYTVMKLWRTMSEETKVTVYCIEKMYRFYSLQDKTALLPEDSLMKIFKITYFLNDKNVDENEKISGDIFFKNTDFTSYYKKTYKNAKIIPYKFINSKLALKIFFENGGLIDENEIKNINFQNLFNDKFVLNRAEEKTKYGI